MRIEVVVIENNPESLNGNHAAVWTEIFDSEEAADLYIQEIDKQEHQFINGSGSPLIFSVLAMVYGNDVNIPRLTIQEFSL